MSRTADPAPPSAERCLNALVEKLSQPPCDELLDLARLHLFDAFVAALAGQATPQRTALCAELGCRSGRGAVPLGWLGLGAPPAPFAVAALSRLVRATELDDLQLASCTTPAAVCVPAALIAATEAGVTEAHALLGGIVAGYEAVYRFGLAAGGVELLRRGGWPTLSVAAVGAAVSAATTLGVTGGEGINALQLGFAATPAFCPRRGSDRLHSFGTVCAAGFEAAIAAAAGSEGDPGPLADAARAGAPFRIEPSRLVPEDGVDGLRRAHFKRWCSAGQAAAAIAAARLLAVSLALRPAEVARVVVEVPPRFRAMIDRPAPADRIESMLSVQYGIALALCDPASLSDCGRTNLHLGSPLSGVMGAVDVRPADDLERHCPERWPARVTVATIDGRSSTLEAIDGPPDADWGWETARRKGSQVLAASGLRCDVESLADAVASFQRVDELCDALEATCAASALPGMTASRGAARRKDRLRGEAGGRQSGARGEDVPALADALRRTAT